MALVKVMTVLAAVIVIQGCSKEVKELTELRDEERALVQATVADAERADRLTGFLDERDRLVAQQAETLRRYREQIIALNADYTAALESFEIAVSRYRSESIQSQQQTLELIVAMKKQTTVEEWKVIARYQLKYLNQREIVKRLSQEGN